MRQPVPNIIQNNNSDPYETNQQEIIPMRQPVILEVQVANPIENEDARNKDKGTTSKKRKTPAKMTIGRAARREAKRAAKG